MKIEIDLDELTAEESEALYNFLGGSTIPYIHVRTEYDPEEDEPIGELPPSLRKTD